LAIGQPGPVKAALLAAGFAIEHSEAGP